MKKFLLLVTFCSSLLYAAEFTGRHASVPARTLRIHQIDLGFPVGDMYLIRLPDDRVIMVDGGDNPSVEEFVFPALKKLNIKSIDTLIITHFHIDHATGILAVLCDPEIKIGQLLYTSMPEKEIPGKFTKDLYSQIMKMAKLRNIPIRKLEVKDKLDFGCGVTATVSGAAQAGSKDRNLNSHSLVFQLKYGDFTMLFTGDCSMQEEPRGMASGMPIKSDVLKIGHHAGANSTSDKFLDTVAPKISIACMPKWLSEDKRGIRVEKMFKARKIPQYRSWEFPDLVVFSDGKTFGVYY